METTEIIAELRKAVAMGDSPVFCGASYIPKRVAMEAADTLERQSRRLRELSETALRLGDEITKQHERTTGDLISRSALLEEYEWLKSVVSPCSVAEVEEHIARINRAPAVEAEPVVRCQNCGWWHRNKQGDLSRGVCDKYAMSKSENGYCDEPLLEERVLWQKKN